MSKVLAIIFLIAIVLVSLPLPAEAQSGFSLVPCGRDLDGDGLEPNEQCQLKHLLIVIVRMINYLVSMAALVAIYQIIAAGFFIVTALGNPENIQKNKEGLRDAVIGFGIVLLSFVFINLLVNGLFGSDNVTRPWWDLNCLYNITSSIGCAI